MQGHGPSRGTNRSQMLHRFGGLAAVEMGREPSAASQPARTGSNRLDARCADPHRPVAPGAALDGPASPVAAKTSSCRRPFGGCHLAAGTTARRPGPLSPPSDRRTRPVARCPAHPRGRRGAGLDHPAHSTPERTSPMLTTLSTTALSESARPDSSSRRPLHFRRQGGTLFRRRSAGDCRFEGSPGKLASFGTRRRSTWKL